MDTLVDYPKIIKQILTQYVELSNRRPNPDIETFLVIDETQTHYMWMNLGWDKNQSKVGQPSERITGCTVYVRIKDGKFWIEEDWTEAGIPNELVNAGVPKEDIVLAFHEPTLRPYTDFAVAS